MGKHFGDLAVVRGIIYYRLSPHEQKPFANAIRYGLPNFIPRTWACIGTWLPVFILGAVTYVAVEETHRKSKKKNPRDYLFEVDPELPPRCVPK